MATFIIDPDNGAGTDYTSLSAGLVGEATTAGALVFECRSSSGTADTTIATVTGMTSTDITIQSTGANRHNGIYDASLYRVIVDTVSNLGMLNINDGPCVIDGLQWSLEYTNDNQRAISRGFIADTTVIKNNIVRGTDKTAGSGMGIWVAGNGGVDHIYNNLIYDISNTGSIGIRPRSLGNSAIYSNTIYNCARGIDRDLRTNNILKNNIINACGSDIDDISYNALSTNNIGDVSTTLLAFGVVADSGTTDGTATNKLIQSGQNFTSTVVVGQVIKNTTDTTYTYVTAIDSDTQLSVNDDIFISGEAFTVYTNMFGSVTFNDAASDDYSIGSSDTLAKENGSDLSSDSALPFSIDILGVTRDDPWSVGAFEFTAGGTTYNESISDGSKSGDTSAVEAIISAALLDGISASDSLSATTVFITAIIDGAISSDSAIGGAVFDESISDGNKAGDSISNNIIFGIQISDGLKSGDTTTNNITFNAQLVDGSLSSDATGNSIVFNAELVDGSIAGDTPEAIAEFIAALSDGIIISDSADGTSNAIAGKLQITFGSKTSSVTINVVAPSLSIDSKTPAMKFS